jgi:hypothetical protein
LECLESVQWHLAGACRGGAGGANDGCCFVQTASDRM